jgi:hypothetical protein
MWFALFTVVLVLAVTFYQSLMGAFTAVINCIIVILSAALAFGFYENLYRAFLVTRQPEHGEAIAMIAIFVLSVVILRQIFDRLITENLHLNEWVDRIGGGGFGFISAMITIGVLATSIQMLPFPATFLGFSRYAEVDTGQDEEGDEPREYDLENRNSLWIPADQFTVGLASHLSSNALKGKNQFAAIYPDFLARLHHIRSNPVGQTLTTVPPNSMQIQQHWWLPEDELYRRESAGTEGRGRNRVDKIKLTEAQVPSGMKGLVVRVEFSSEAKGEGGALRFKAEQVRLVGREREGADTENYYLGGINLAQDGDYMVIVEPAEGFAREPAGKTQLDFLFFVPDVDSFQPVFVEYKRNARAFFGGKPVVEEVPAPLAGSEEPDQNNQAKQSTPSGRRGSATGDRPQGDRISGLGTAREARFSNEMPFEQPLTNYAEQNVELERDGLVDGGRVRARLDDDFSPREGTKRPIRGFAVPDDRRCLQLSVAKLQPESWLGNIYGGIIDTIGDFYLVDENGDPHRVVGAYCMARVGRNNVFELIYLDEIQRQAGAKLPKFERIRTEHMKGDYALVYIFHLPPGTRPAKLHTGRTDVDLGELNLVAPR